MREMATTTGNFTWIILHASKHSWIQVIYCCIFLQLKKIRSNEYDFIVEHSLWNSQNVLETNVSSVKTSVKSRLYSSILEYMNRVRNSDLNQDTVCRFHWWPGIFALPSLMI